MGLLEGFWGAHGIAKKKKKELNLRFENDRDKDSDGGHQRRNARAIKHAGIK